MLQLTEMLLHERDAANLLNVSVSWLQKGRVYGYGPPFIRLRNGRGPIRYRLSDLKAYLAKNTFDPESVPVE